MNSKPLILITGANGLLGRNLLARLIESHEVHALVHVPPLNPIPGVKYHPIDLAREWSIDELPPHMDSVIHLAQSSQFRNFPESALDVFKVNIESTARLLDYANKAGVRQFIHASSGGIYGNSNQAFNENSPIVPPDKLGYYLGSKFCGEVLVNSYSALMQVLVLRFFFMYGPGQNRSMLIPRLLDNVRDGRSIGLQGENGIRINPIHVDDAALAVIAAINTTESTTYNIAGPDILSLKDIGGMIGKVVGVKPCFEYLEGQPNDLIGENTHMRERLHEPAVKLEDGIKDLL